MRRFLEKAGLTVQEKLIYSNKQIQLETVQGACSCVTFCARVGQAFPGITHLILELETIIVYFTNHDILTNPEVKELAWCYSSVKKQ